MVDIALNTIVYAMIFIFPGILFRKFLFVREHSMEFEKGHLFERFIWTLFTSISMLVFIAGLFYTFRKVLDVQLLPYISYNTIRETFAELSTNNLPDPKVKKDIGEIYHDFALLMICVYFLSVVFGLLAFYLTRSGLFRSTGLLKSTNYYQDLVVGSNQKNTDDSLIYLYTSADVLVDAGESSKLYSGTLKNYFLESGSSKLETIVLCDAVRYKKDGDIVTIKEIPGHNFIISKDRILNLNFTYVYEKKEQNKGIRRLKWIINIIFTIALIFLAASLFIDDIYVYTSTYLRKLVFLVCGFITILFINQQTKIVLSGQKSLLKLEDFFYFVLFILPFFWIFNIFSWYYVLSSQILLWIVTALIFEKKKKECNSSGETQSGEAEKF